MSQQPTAEELTARASRFVSVLPHCRVLGMQVEYADGEKVILSLPYSEAIIGNASNGVIAGGALTTLMDTACGTAVFNVFHDNEICPTLDLRIDYFKAATPGETLRGEAWVDRVTNNVVFAKGQVVEGPENRIIATCTANFMRIGQHIGGKK